MKKVESGYCYLCSNEKTEEVYEFGLDMEDNFCWICGDCLREKVKELDVMKTTEEIKTLKKQLKTLKTLKTLRAIVMLVLIGLGAYMVFEMIRQI